MWSKKLSSFSSTMLSLAMGESSGMGAVIGPAAGADEWRRR